MVKEKYGFVSSVMYQVSGLFLKRAAFCTLALIFVSLPVSGCYAQNKGNIISEQKDTKKEDPFLWDFGQVKEGEILTHEFTLKNESKAVLNIRDINTSCGCTVSEIKKKTLAPGEKTSIEVKFDSKGYSGDVQQFIYVNTDSLDNPILRYIIKAEVVK